MCRDLMQLLTHCSTTAQTYKVRADQLLKHRQRLTERKVAVHMPARMAYRFARGMSKGPGLTFTSFVACRAGAPGAAGGNTGPLASRRRGARSLSRLMLTTADVMERRQDRVRELPFGVAGGVDDNRSIGYY